MGQELVIKRVFDAPKAHVWKAWTNPEEAKKWWGPKGFTAPVIEIDFRVGGRYLYCMRGAVTPGGKEQDFWSTGVYLEITPMEKIVVIDSFSDEKGNVVPATHYGMSADFPREMKVVTIFEEQGDKTKFTLRHKSFPESDVEGARQGWNSSLDKLAESLEEQRETIGASFSSPKSDENKS